MAWRIRRETYNLTVVPGPSVTTVGTAAASATAGINFNGLLQAVLYTAPASVDGAATITVSVVDQDQNSVWSKSGIAAGSGTTIVNLTPNATAGAANQSIPLSGNYQVLITFSANQTTTASQHKVVLMVDQG